MNKRIYLIVLSALFGVLQLGPGKSKKNKTDNLKICSVECCKKRFQYRLLMGPFELTQSRRGLLNALDC